MDNFFISLVFYIILEAEGFINTTSDFSQKFSGLPPRLGQIREIFCGATSEGYSSDFSQPCLLKNRADPHNCQFSLLTFYLPKLDFLKDFSKRNMAGRVPTLTPKP